MEFVFDDTNLEQYRHYQIQAIDIALIVCTLCKECIHFPGIETWPADPHAVTWLTEYVPIVCIKQVQVTNCRCYRPAHRHSVAHWRWCMTVDRDSYHPDAWRHRTSPLHTSHLNSERCYPLNYSTHALVFQFINSQMMLLSMRHVDCITIYLLILRNCSNPMYLLWPRYTLLDWQPDVLTK
jgi:hypothetical protein